MSVLSMRLAGKLAFDSVRRRVSIRAALILALGAVVLVAQTPKPAQSAAPGPPPAAAPKSQSKQPAPAKSAPAPRRDAVDSYSLGLPLAIPTPVRLLSPPVERLANGLGLVIVQTPSLPLVDVAVFLSNGYSHDPAGKRGLTRAVAFGMRYGGTPTRSEREVEEYLLARNLTLNVSVGPELTEWNIRCRKEDLAGVLELMAEMFTRPAFRRGALEDIWGQMRLAVLNRGQNLEETAAHEVESAWFGANASWTRRNQPAEIQALSREAITAHFAQSVAPSRSVIGLNGDIDGATARQLLGRTFGAWNAVKLDRVSTAPLPRPTRKMIVLDKPNSPTARLLLALPLKQRATERKPAEAAALGLLAALLDPGQESKLDAALAPYQSPEAPIRVVSGLGLGELPLLRVSVPLRPREAIDGAVALWKELRILQAGKIAPARLEAARRAFLRNIVFQSSTATARFQLLMKATALGVAPGHLESIQQAAASMMPADYERILKEQLDLDAALLVLTGDERDYRSPAETAGMPVVRVSATPTPETSSKAADNESARAEAARVLSEVRKAMGGDEALAAIRDAYWEYEAKLTRASPPIIVTQHNRWLEPGYYRQEQTSKIGNGITYFDGKVGWTHNGRNLMTLTPGAAQQFRNEIVRLLFRLVMADRLEGYTALYAGSGIVRVTSPEKYEVELALDFQTNLPERLRFLERRPNGGAPIPVEELLSGYRRVDGVLMPHRVLVKQGGQEFADFTVKSMRFNTGITEEQIGKKP